MCNFVRLSTRLCWSLSNDDICCQTQDKYMYLRITHDYIARYIGTSRERVTKTLKKFSEKNLIQKTKGCIEIKNIEKLRQLAFFSHCVGNDLLSDSAKDLYG